MAQTRKDVKQEIELLNVMARLGLLRDSLYSPPDPDVVELVTSELATNATFHGTGDSFLIRTGLTPDGHFFVAVANDGEPIPSPKKAKAEEVEGRGLYIVSQLSTRWGLQRNVTINDQEKVWDNVVWVKFSGQKEQNQEAVNSAVAAVYAKSLAREGFDLEGLE